MIKLKNTQDLWISVAKLSEVWISTVRTLTVYSAAVHWCEGSALLHVFRSSIKSCHQIATLSHLSLLFDGRFLYLLLTIVSVHQYYYNKTFLFFIHFRLYRKKNKNIFSHILGCENQISNLTIFTTYSYIISHLLVSGVALLTALFLSDGVKLNI